jgi:hypothetical protein
MSYDTAYQQSFSASIQPSVDISCIQTIEDIQRKEYKGAWEDFLEYANSKQEFSPETKREFGITRCDDTVDCIREITEFKHLHIVGNDKEMRAKISRILDTYIRDKSIRKLELPMMLKDRLMDVGKLVDNYNVSMRSSISNYYNVTGVDTFRQLEVFLVAALSDGFFEQYKTERLHKFFQSELDKEHLIKNMREENYVIDNTSITNKSAFNSNSIELDDLEDNESKILFSNL